MASWNIADVFNAPKYHGRKDSAFQDLMSQFENFSAARGERSSSFSEDAHQATMTFTPGIGSSCISLYPRTKTFTFHSAIDNHTCLATCDNSYLWRITAEQRYPEDGVAMDNLRFTFERLPSPPGSDSASDELYLDDEAPIEIFKKCTVKVAGPGKQSHRRRISIGNYSSGFGTSIMPLSPSEMSPMGSPW